MRKLFVCLILAALAVPATASETITLTDTKTLFGNGGWLVSTSVYDDYVTWEHEMDLSQFSKIESASITITALDLIDPAPIEIEFNETFIGTMNFSASNSQESLPIDTDLIYDPLKGTATLRFEPTSGFFGWLDSADSVMLLTSTLEVSGVAAVPAPGAILLAGLGVSLVGAVRRKRG